MWRRPFIHSKQTKMTPEETEFAQLLDAYTSALSRRSLASQTPPTQPGYQTENGHITPKSIASYKQALATYEQQKAAFEASEAEVQTAVAALDAYFPPAVSSELKRGVAMMSNLPGGVVALLKQGKEYEVIRGKDLADVKYRIESRAPQKR